MKIASSKHFPTALAKRVENLLQPESSCGLSDRLLGIVGMRPLALGDHFVSVWAKCEKSIKSCCRYKWSS
ncbi:hypothetical protein SUGI_1205590 [Cryptomeria japonica]|nr:hypothetical protein SUGI_1205590 [Cryptomeria japonica]